MTRNGFQDEYCTALYASFPEKQTEKSVFGSNLSPRI
jgi:hypothetical protein